jgi:hypothetical protein
MSKFFKKIRTIRTRREVVPEPPQELLALQSEYVDLCCHNTRFRREHAAEDFLLLAEYHRITNLAVNLFTESLYIGTTEVCLQSEDATHRVGRFLIEISRRDNSFRFENVDSPYIKMSERYYAGDGAIPDTEVRVAYPHPHVHPNGSMCMPEGTIILQNAIGSGDLYTASRMAVDALYISNGGHPVLPVTNWPKIEEL